MAILLQMLVGSAMPTPLSSCVRLRGQFEKLMVLLDTYRFHEYFQTQRRPAFAAGATLIADTVEHASTILAPALARLLPEYPGLKVEIINDYGMTDIVTERFDAGVRLGESVDQDMIAVRISPDFERAVVASPAYFANHAKPRTPHDLTAHACLNLRLPTSGGLWPWPFAKSGQALKVRTDGPPSANTINLARDMALAGVGLAYLPEDIVGNDIVEGRLVQVLKDWSTPASGTTSTILAGGSRIAHSPCL